MIYRFRIILDNDTEDDVFRDLEIREEDTLEDLHNTITQSFGFDGSEMASFYMSNEAWEQGEEISLFDMSEGINSVKLMSNTKINEVVHEAQTKMIYVYDFMSMWTFFVELAEIVEVTEGTDYPNLMFVNGKYQIMRLIKLLKLKVLMTSLASLKMTLILTITTI